MLRRLLFPSLALALVVACDSGGTSPDVRSSVKVVTVTGGTNLDPDGYRLRIVGAPPRHIGTNDSVTIDSLQFGNRTFNLDSIAGNCTADSAQQTWYLFVGNSNRHEFHVVCT